MMRRPATLPIVCALLLTSTAALGDRKSTRLNSSHSQISYAVFCLKKKKNSNTAHNRTNFLNVPTHHLNTSKHHVYLVGLELLPLPGLLLRRISRSPPASDTICPSL